MEKFKLIKEYPDSPKLGTVIKLIGNLWRYKVEDQERIALLSKNTPADYPEYWEEVIEKDY